MVTLLIKNPFMIFDLIETFKFFLIKVICSIIIPSISTWDFKAMQDSIMKILWNIALENNSSSFR